MLKLADFQAHNCFGRNISTDRNILGMWTENYD